MSQTVASVANHPSVVTANDSSNNCVYVATTSTVTTISSCTPQQQYSPPQSSVPGQYTQLPSYTESFQPKIKLLTRPQTANGTPGNEAPLNHQAAMMEQLTSSASNVVVGVSSATGLPVIASTLSCEENNEWQPPVALVMPSERCDDENPSVNLQEFLFNTMRSPQDNRDRVFLLQLESNFTSYINDPMQTAPLTLPPDTSYHRMLAHRVAAYFGLKHSVDSTGNSVVVWKIAESKVPEQRFEDYIPVEEKEILEPKKQILKRSKDLIVPVGSSQKLDQQSSGITNADMKSMEEKQEAYDRAKARIFSQEPSTSQPRNGSRQILLSETVDNSSTSGNSTEHNDSSKFPPEGGDTRDDGSPGSRSRSSSQGSNMSTNRTTPSRNRSNNRRPQPTKYSSRQPYVPAGYVPGLASQPVNPGMLYYQQQQQAAMLQQYNNAAAAAAAGYPQYLQYAHNPMVPAAALYSQPNVNSYAFQPQPTQQLYAMPGGQVYSVLANPAMRPGAVYMHSQQQGSFHHPHLQPTAAAATAGIIRPVPQHAQPQANRFVSKPVHGPGNSWKPTFSQQQMAAAAAQQLRANSNANTTTSGASTAASSSNAQEYQLANYIDSNLTLNDETRQETESPEQQQQPATTSSQKITTQQSSVTQYAVPLEQDVQNPTTVPESIPAIRCFPHITSSGQVQYIMTASPMVNSHGYQNQFTGAAVTAASPYSYQLQNAPSTPPINMINPSQPVLFSPPSSGPPTPSHYIPQGLFSPPPQPAILVGMGTQQLSNLVTQQNSAEVTAQTRQTEESGDRNGSSSGGGGGVETNALGSQVADATSTPTKIAVPTSGSFEVVQKQQQTPNDQEEEISTAATVATTTTTTTSATSTATKHKEVSTSNTYTSTELPPRFQQRSGGSTTRYQNQRHPSNRQNTKQVAIDSTNVAMTTNHYGPMPATVLPKREPLLPTPTVACIIPHEPIPSGGQEILEILNFPAEGPQHQAALVELKKLNASILNIKKVNGADIFVAKFESVHQAQLAMQQTIKQQQPYQLVIPTGLHSKIIHTALSRRQQSANRTS